MNDEARAVLARIKGGTEFDIPTIASALAQARRDGLQQAAHMAREFTDGYNSAWLRTTAKQDVAQRILRVFAQHLEITAARHKMGATVEGKKKGKAVR